MRGARPFISGLLLLLSACATTQQAGPGPEPVEHRILLAPSALPGWENEDHLAAFQAWRDACDLVREEAYRRPCTLAKSAGSLDEAGARDFFEANFRAEPLDGTGLLTGYFAPEYEAREQPDEIFSAPVRPRPPELVRGADGKFPPWQTRAEIERTPGEALAFMRPEDLFFMQIQGSGYLRFPDGREVRAAYAADNGQPFVGIARPMAAQGLLPANGTSGEAIRAWLAEHRGSEADAVTDLNPRYIFFALEPDDGGQPRGAAGRPLPAGHAAAVDPAFHAWGEPLWIDADTGTLTGAARGYRRLVLALDAGGAIKGPVRADLYLGRGEAAGDEAGRIRHPLKMWWLRPKP